MNKKTIFILASVSAVLLLLIGAAVYVLYSGIEPEESSCAPTPSHSVLLRAVPSDAAAVLCFSDIRKGTLFLTDPSGMFSPVFSRTRSRSFLNFLSGISAAGIHGAPMVLSLHFSGNLEPLLIVDAGRAGSDTTSLAERIISSAKDCGLSAELVPADRQMLIVSASEALVGSSKRHIEGKMSIMDNRGFVSSLSKTQGMNEIFISNDYAPQLVSTYLDRPYRKYSDFLKRFSDWTALGIAAASDHHLVLKGGSVCGKNPSYYQHVLEGVGGAESRLADILPRGTSFSVTLTCTDSKKFQPLFEKYLDASGKLPARKKALSDLKASMSDPMEWHSSVSVKEVTMAQWQSGANTYSAIFLRTSEKSKDAPEIVRNNISGFPSALYGDLFSLPDESCMIRADVWTVIGSRDALSDWKDCGRLNIQMPSTSFAACVIIPPMVMQWEDDEIRVEAMPVALPVGTEDGRGAVSAPSASLQISKGPFKVKNCATGKINQFYQNEHLSLCLNDENGKGMWGVSFDRPICGCVETVDYYGNGKLQFLFCAGSKLYLIDRLGRFVTGFPAALDEEVVLGPAVYDFSGAKRYNALVLHKGNKIDMYNLKGVKPEGWKGITSQYSITSLPKLVTVDGKYYWKLETAGGAQAFDFLGGEPLKGKIEKTVTK